MHFDASFAAPEEVVEQPPDVAAGGVRRLGRHRGIDPRDGVAYDPVKNLAYSSNGRDGTITVVRATDFKVVETIPSARGARTIALDEKTHHLFLPTAKLEPAEPRWKVVAGTFEVIEVAP